MAKVEDDFITPEMLAVWNRLTAMQAAKPDGEHYDDEYRALSGELRRLLALKPWEWGPDDSFGPNDLDDDGRSWALRQAFERASRAARAARPRRERASARPRGRA